MSIAGDLGRLKDMGRRLFGGDSSKVSKKVDSLPAGVGAERRSGRRIHLPLSVRVKIGGGDPRKARLRDVNLNGLALEPAEHVRVGDWVNIGFDGYPDVCPAFALIATVKRIMLREGLGGRDAMGLEIDRERTSAQAQQNYRRLVLHYLHHRPLLDRMTKGYFEGRCRSCSWLGRVGARKPRCPKCGSKVVPSPSSSKVG